VEGVVVGGEELLMELVEELTDVGLLVGSIEAPEDWAVA
jgi:hypothetical protein